MSRLRLTVVDGAPEGSSLPDGGAAGGAWAADGLLHPCALARSLDDGLTPGALGICDAVRPRGYDVVQVASGPGALGARAPGRIEVRRAATPAAVADDADVDWSLTAVCAVARATSHTVDLSAALRARELLVVEGGRVRWEDTVAWAVGHGQVWVNLLGREPGGLVTPGAEYEAVRDALIRSLRALTDADGRPVVAAVRRREDVYQGSAVHQLPDLVVDLAPHARFAVTDPGAPGDAPEPVAVAPGAGWAPGWYSVRGPGIRAGARAAIAPAALHALALALVGVPAAPACDAPLPAALLTDARRADQAPGGDPALSRDDEALITERLRNLGYLE